MKPFIAFFVMLCLSCVAYADFNKDSKMNTMDKKQDSRINTHMDKKDVKEMNKIQKEFPQDTFATPSDQELNKKIREEVSLGYFWNSYKTIRLNTINGVVTLEGTVKNADEAQKLIPEIKKINGVKAINNKLQFQDK